MPLIVIVCLIIIVCTFKTMLTSSGSIGIFAFLKNLNENVNKDYLLSKM